jgi:nucleoid-associated protein YgaU
MNCPLCDYKGLADDALNCPSCNADLSVYRSLDDVERAMGKQKKRTLLFVILFFIALLGCFAIYIILNSGEKAEEPDISETTGVEFQNMQADNDKLNAEVKKLEAELSSTKAELATAKENQLTTHVIAEGESLFTIAEKYFGDGEKYLKIADDNCLDDPDLIVVGTELIILK